MREKKILRLGFSLIEVMFAFVITFTLIIGTAQLTLNSLWSKRKSEFRFEATAIISSKLERLKSLPFSSPELREGDFSERVEGDLSDQVYLCEWQIQAVSSNMKSVQLECFPESAPDNKIQLYCFISQELGF